MIKTSLVLKFDIKEDKFKLMKEWYLQHNMITSFALKTAGSYIGLIWWKIKILQLEILSPHKDVRMYGASWKYTSDVLRACGPFI